MPPRKTFAVLKSVAYGAVATAVISKLVSSAMKPESQILGRTLVAGQNPDEWALTFDDGPNPHSTPRLLDVLARHDVKATFFVIGKFVREHAALVRRVRAEGHLVGNHTMSHPFLATKPMSLVRREILDCNALLEETLGEPVNYFRAPFGARRPGILRFLRKQGLIPVQWNVQGNDWEPIGVEGILARIAPDLARARARGVGANILLHDGFDEKQGHDRNDTIAATEALIENAQRKGIRMVTVDHWT